MPLFNLATSLLRHLRSLLLTLFSPSHLLQICVYMCVCVGEACTRDTMQREKQKKGGIVSATQRNNRTCCMRHIF